MTFALWTLVIGVLLSRPEARPAPIEPGLAVAAAPGLRVHDPDRGTDRRGRSVATRSTAGRGHSPRRDSRPHRPGTCNCLRFGLTGEGGLNDGTAFPFVMLGLGLLGLHDLGMAGWHWLAVDVVWATAGGLLIGGACGALIGGLVVYLRTRHRVSVGLDEFLALGLIALAYGAAVLAHAYGFLSVFAAGLALRRVKEQSGMLHLSAAVATRLPNGRAGNETDATHADHASAYMMHAVRGFNEQMERIGELVVVLMVGAMLPFVDLRAGAVGLLVLVFLAIRPLSVWLGLLGAPISQDQRVMIAWFGIRGIGSIYYLMYAIDHGLPRPLAEQITVITLAAVTVSIVLHGISVRPMMHFYWKRTVR